MQIVIFLDQEGYSFTSSLNFQNNSVFSTTECLLVLLCGYTVLEKRKDIKKHFTTNN